jgi:hypothetical protein
MLEPNPYAHYLDSRPVLDILEATPGTLARLTRHIGPEQMQLPRTPGKWSPAQILCHLADCELAFGYRLRQAAAEDHHVIQPFDQDKWSAPYSNIPADQALATYTTLRTWNLIMIRHSLPVAAHKPVTHPERGEITFTTVVETMAGHDLNHLQQFQALAGVSS